MSQSTFFQDILDDMPLGIVVLDRFDYVIEMNKYACDVLHCTKEDVVKRMWFHKFPSIFRPHMKQQRVIPFTYGSGKYLLETQPLLRNGQRAGTLLVIRKTTEIEEVIQEADCYQELSADLQAIFDISYDVLYVSDAQGITLKVSSACEKLWGLKEKDLIGKSIYELEKREIFKPSITRLVLEKKEKVSVIQTTKTGRRLMVVGTPIKNEQGEIMRIVNASRDITEVSKLQAELEQLRNLSEGYKKELIDLRRKDEVETQIIYRSQQMRDVISISQTASQIDSTVLLLGESGVGKELIASYIHKWSPRHTKPFVTFHCSSISDTLLERELFGSDESLDDSRMSLFEMAHEGTLYLDEVCSMPLQIQAKLLRVLDRMEVVRKGGTYSTKVNVRIIASTNRNVQEEIAAGNFREDLYYRLLVVPIEIPPLRYRQDDILPLIFHFVTQKNKKHKLQKKFDSEAIAKLQAYQWPGNVRELQNIIERVMLTQEGDILRLHDLPSHIITSQEEPDVQVNRIIPLKEALTQVEKGLLQLAKKKYGSTTRMAKALGVNQSTISRKLSQHKGV